MSTAKVGGESPSETPAKGGRELTPERFAAETGIPLTTIMDWLHPNTKRSPYRIDARDVRRYGRKTVTIIHSLPNAAGLGARPRLVPREGVNP